MSDSPSLCLRLFLVLLCLSKVHLLVLLLCVALLILSFSCWITLSSCIISVVRASLLAMNETWWRLSGKQKTGYAWKNSTCIDYCYRSQPREADMFSWQHWHRPNLNFTSATYKYEFLGSHNIMFAKNIGRKRIYSLLFYILKLNSQY